MSWRLAVRLALALSAQAALARAEDCGRSARGFDAWLSAERDRAIAAGVPKRVAHAALDGLEYDAEVIRLDRSQRPFKLPFERFLAKRVTRAKVALGRAMLARHETLLRDVYRAYGVHRAVLVAIWGLETDFGLHTGDRPVFRSLATLAYDCRRAERFRGELSSALRVVARGDMLPSDMRGAWAGELGQTQFLPSSYEKYAVDFDEDGRRDLIGSTADVLASTAFYLFSNGWREGGGWQPGTANFEVLKSWNSSSHYQRTIAIFAERLAER
ncbi:MAG: lytic murein transglycosylase [Polyangiaceae bacterium]|nr:lytic murein transglycosylase [Polyangiaceae bacterium]